MQHLSHNIDSRKKGTSKVNIIHMNEIAFALTSERVLTKSLMEDSEEQLLKARLAPS
jgi:hypothetical protein